MAKNKWKILPDEALRVQEGFQLKDFDPGATPGWTAGKAAARGFQDGRRRLLSELQEGYFACSKMGDDRRILLVVQGLDTAGKGGISRHVMGMVDPQGVQLASFGKPTEQELSEHFLCRIERQLPHFGKIGVFDRSHYEDVLVQRVRNIVPPEIWGGRYDIINDWERYLVQDQHFTIVKLALMVSHDEQARRLAQRLDRRDKWWKYQPGDIDTRRDWDAYQEAYQAVFTLTSTPWAPWYVIPSDHKWYTRLVTTELLTQALISLDQHWPEAQWDFATEKERLLSTCSPRIAKEISASLDGIDPQVKEETDEFRKAVNRALEGKSTESYC